jgi:hypothetical protein
MEIIEDNESELNIRIRDADLYRFTLPYRIPFAHTKQRASTGPKQYSYILPKVNEPLSVVVLRASNN